MTRHVLPGSVVVGVDGSAQGWHALRWAAVRAEQQGRPLHIMHAGDADSAYGPAFDDGPMDNVCDEALGIVTHHHPRLAISWSQPAGPPVPIFVEASEVADELVLGTRGVGAVRGAVLGSVATQVSAAAHCPVLIARDAVTERQLAGPVVVGVDDRPDGIAALDFAFAEAARGMLPLVAVLSWRVERWDFAAGIPLPGANLEAAGRDHRARLDAALAGPVAQHPEVPVVPLVVCAPATPELVERSAQASLLVVGTRGHRAVASLVLGSVSQGVLRRAQCPVAVVAYGARNGSAVAGGRARM
ncbi:universal stress protein [Flexivirga caeni]|uniref:Universal stress protein n=1 Tax=Flexivirga caeni TaxID=2294115 RepID=A0A3M9M4J9_9MICO|nr:universal stress protein [Flexivirga caeni]RNI19468.1 universal stress protein [Flexivirga caeni]